MNGDHRVLLDNRRSIFKGKQVMPRGLGTAISSLDFSDFAVDGSVAAISLAACDLRHVYGAIREYPRRRLPTVFGP